MFCEFKYATWTFWIFRSPALAIGGWFKCFQKFRRSLTFSRRLLDHLHRHLGAHVGAIVEQQFQYVSGLMQGECQQQRRPRFSRLFWTQTIFDQTTYDLRIGFGKGTGPEIATIVAAYGMHIRSRRA